MSVKIIITDPKGKDKIIKVDPSDTIEACKKTAGLEPKQWRWTFNGDILKDDKTVNDYELEDDDKILCSKETFGGIIL